MNANASNDGKKVAVLIVAIVAVFGFLAWRLISGSAPSAPDVAPISATPPTGTNLTDPAPPGSSPMPGAADIVTFETPENAEAVDPFKTVLEMPAPSLKSQPPAMKGKIGPLVPLIGGDIPTEKPRLSGVMSGDPPIGVFVIAGKEEIHRQGEKLSNGDLVRSIKGEIAVLVSKKKIIRLQISPNN